MSAVARPPVNEVALAISFQPQSVLEGPRLMVGLGSILAEFPDVTEVPPYEMSVEQPFEEQLLRPSAPSIKFMGAQSLPRRYWFTTPGSSPLLLQVQENYFALNWRRQDDEPYPGFDRLVEEFESYLSKFQDAIIAQGGAELQITQLELTYINILKPDGIWGSTADLGKVVALQAAGLEKCEQLNFTYSRSLNDTNSGEFYGRLHAAVATGYTPKIEPTDLLPLRAPDVIPVINVSLTGRSGEIDERVAGLARRFEPAHDAVTEAFKGLTTDAARRSWGLL